jgi:hypothetical protein
VLAGIGTRYSGRDGIAPIVVADRREVIGQEITKERSPSDSCRFGAQQMIDILYLIVGTLFFVAAWVFTKACDKL